MKKSNLVLMVIGSLLVFSNCSDKYDGEIAKSTGYMSADLELVGKRHNDGLDFLFLEFEKSQIGIAYNSSRKKGLEITKDEELEILKFLDIKSKEFLEKNPLSYNGEKIYSVNFTFSDKQLFSMLDYNFESLSYTKLQNKYFDEINNAYSRSNTNNELNRIVKEITQSAELEIVDELELLPILIMAGILVDSDLYWNESSKKGWPGIAMADAANGISGAVWGSVAGPIGAIAVGVNAALIGSCTAFLMEQL